MVLCGRTRTYTFPALHKCRFNKREDDFPTLREYNDYLEEVEDMSMYEEALSLDLIVGSSVNVRPVFSFEAFNLIEGIDVPAIEAKIAKYQVENAEQIINSRARRVF